MLLDVCKEQLEAFGDCAGETMVVQVLFVLSFLFAVSSIFQKAISFLTTTSTRLSQSGKEMAAQYQIV
jgi:hypothetical protein